MAHTSTQTVLHSSIYFGIVCACSVLIGLLLRAQVGCEVDGPSLEAEGLPRTGLPGPSLDAEGLRSTGLRGKGMVGAGAGASSYVPPAMLAAMAFRQLLVSCCWRDNLMMALTSPFTAHTSWPESRPRVLLMCCTSFERAWRALV